MDNQKFKKIIWEKLSKKGADYSMSLGLVKSTISSLKVPEVEYKNIYNLLRRLAEKGSITLGELYTPIILLNLLSELLKDHNFESVLIPFESDGAITNLVNELSNGEAEIQSYFLNLDIYDLVKNYLPNYVNTIKGSFLKQAQNNKKYDLVVADIPLGMGREKESYDYNGEEYNISDYTPHHILLKSALQLEDNGIGIYPVADNFFSTTQKNVYSFLNNFDLSIKGIIKMPTGTYPSTSISPNIIILSKSKDKDVFLAKATDKNIEKVVANYKKRINAEIPELGSLTNQKKLKAPDVFFQIEKIKEFARDINSDICKISELAKSIELPDRNSNDGGFKNKDNSIFIPKIGNSSVVKDKNDFKIKAQNYIQLIFKGDKEINLDFIIGFLNTERGLEIRRSWSRGTAVKQISKTSLGKGIIPMPPKSYQDKVIDIHKNISEYEALLAENRNKLWNNILSFKEVKKIVSKFQKMDSLEIWLEDLPFPLASILWRYRSEKEARDKVDNLLYFFESNAEFFSSIFLSASYPDKEWLEDLVDKKTDFKKPTFGLWTTICDKAMKKYRRIFSSGKESNGREGGVKKLQEYMKTENEDYLRTISNKQLQKILNEAREIRNKVSHTKISKQEYRNILNKLENLLVRYREIVGVIFSSINLISPISSKYKNGVNINKVHLLNGTRTPFKKITITTNEQLEDGKLHLYDKNAKKVLRLLPFLRLDSSPKEEQDAVYYYNKIDDERECYTAYHLENITSKKYNKSDLSSNIKKIKDLIEDNF